MSETFTCEICGKYTTQVWSSLNIHQKTQKCQRYAKPLREVKKTPDGKILWWTPKKKSKID